MKFLKIAEGEIISIDAITSVQFNALERPFDKPVAQVEITVSGASRPFTSLDPGVIKWISAHLDVAGVIDATKLA